MLILAWLGPFSPLHDIKSAWLAEESTPACQYVSVCACKCVCVCVCLTVQLQVSLPLSSWHTAVVVGTYADTHTHTHYKHYSRKNQHPDTAVAKHMKTPKVEMLSFCRVVWCGQGGQTWNGAGSWVQAARGLQCTLNCSCCQDTWARNNTAKYIFNFTDLVLSLSHLPEVKKSQEAWGGFNNTVYHDVLWICQTDKQKETLNCPS